MYFHKPIGSDHDHDDRSFERLLASSAETHGHLCPGQVIGVRMAILGCRLIDFEVPCPLPQLKKLIVFVEMDRCTSDAVAHTTGVRLGRRSLKFKNYGIMAATFVNLETGRAIRVLSTEDARDLANFYAPEIPEKRPRQIEAYKRMPDSVLFKVQEVKVELSSYDMPGPTTRKTMCANCGQIVRDNREVVVEGRSYCRICADEVYFTDAKEISWPGMNWSPLGREKR